MNKENSSGQGAIPYRRYSPRPAKAADLVISRLKETGENSKTDSIVWMREEKGMISNVQLISSAEFLRRFFALWKDIADVAAVGGEA